jgi:hypothetical protein
MVRKRVTPCSLVIVCEGGMKVGNKARFEFQTRMLEKGVEALQQQIGRSDEIVFKIKVGAMTVWVAFVGWALTTRHEGLILLGFVVIIGFWFLEGFLRGVQLRYILRAEDIARLLNDRERLDKSFTALEFPADIIFAVSFRETGLKKLGLYGKGMITPSVAIPYLLFACINCLVLINRL